jgi:lipoprotein-anchoring transpeptidase ErfK/SrfK
MRRFWMFAVASLIGSQPMRLVANIPAFRLEVFVGDSLARTISIAPGMPNFRTPRGPYAITSVEWNPWWSPPKSAWAAREKPTRPGGTNPMGRVKLNVRPLYLLHGTPAERSTGSAASHGCIRLKNADALALADLARISHEVSQFCEGRAFATTARGVEGGRPPDATARRLGGVA